MGGLVLGHVLQPTGDLKTKNEPVKHLLIVSEMERETQREWGVGGGD